MKKERSRIQYFDVAKGIAILCVILAHFSVPDIPDLLHRICFSFHMPIFFVIAGYFFREKSMPELLRIKAKRLLVPYLFCAIGVIFFSLIWNYFLQVPVSAEKNIIEWIKAAIYGSGGDYFEPFNIKSIGAIWFLLAMFWCLLLFNFCLKRKTPILWVVLFVTMGYYLQNYFWMPYSILAALISVGYFYVGYKSREADFLNYINERPSRIAMLFLLWAFYLVAGGGNLYLVGGYFGKGLIYDLFFSSVSVFCVLQVSRWFSDRQWKIKNVVLFFGKNSLTVLCFHLIELNTFPWHIFRAFLESREIHGYLVISMMYVAKVMFAVTGVVVVNYLTAKWNLKKAILVKKEPSGVGKDIFFLSLSPFEYRRDACMLMGIVALFVIVGEFPLAEPVRQVIYSFHLPLLFVAAGYILAQDFSRSLMRRWSCTLISAYIACRIGYLAVQLWQSLLYSSGADSGVILRDWTTVSFWGMSNASTILSSVGNVGVVWVLPALLVTGVLCGIVIRLKCWIVQLLASILISAMGIWLGRHVGFLPFSVDVAMASVPFFWTGYAMYRYDWIKQMEKPQRLLVLSFCWLILVKWNGIDLIARKYPYGVVGVICASAACTMIIFVVNELNLPDVLRAGLGYAGKYFLLFLGIHSIMQRLAPWGAAVATTSVTVQLLIEVIIAGTTGIMLVLITRVIAPLFEKRIYVDRLYLAVLAIYLVRAIFDTTMFHFPWLISFYPIVRIFALVVAWIRINQAEREKWNNLFPCLAAAAVFCFSYTMTGYEFLFDLGILMIGAVGVPSQKILKVYFASVVVIMYLALIGSFTGVISELVYKEGELYKHSFGICYPTDFAAHLVYLMLVFWVLSRKLPSIITAAIMTGLMILQLEFCGTQCSEIVMALSVTSVGYVAFSGWLMRQNRILRKIIGSVDYLICMAAVFCAAVIVILTIKYNTEVPVLNWINQILSGRLKLAQDAFQQYGMSWFGTAFEMVGNGSAVVDRAGYNFVDSSFCLILVRYGILPFVTILLMSVLAGIKGIKGGNRRVAFALALIAVHSMIEHHLIELAYNPFLLLAFCDMRDMNVKNDTRCEVEDELMGAESGGAVLQLEGAVAGVSVLSVKTSRVLQKGIYAASVTILLLFAPAILTYGRTLVTLLRLYENQRQLLFIIALLCLTAAIVIFIRQAAGVIARKKDRHKSSRYLTAGSALIVAFSLAVGEGTIKKYGAKYEETVAAGIRLIEAVSAKLDDIDYKIYVDDIPALYQREIDGISNRVFPAVGTLKEDNVIMITDKSKDIFRLTGAGYQFGELSDQEGIYTNSEKAVQAIEELGIPMMKCYSVEKTVDLGYLAALNGLEISENGSLIVDGQEKSLIYGPYETVYNGIMEVTFRLKLLNSSIAEGEVAAARLSADSGKRILERKPVNRSDFNENGECTVVIKKGINNSEGVEFLVFANADTKIEVQSITYRKVEE